MSEHPLRILVAGGGSSGHISPALAVIEALRRPEHARAMQFLYLGGTTGLERRIVESAGIPFAGIATGKLRRYFSSQNLTDLFRIPWGLAQSLQHLSKFQPHVVLSTGGYVSVPPVLAAWMKQVPVVMHEQTAQLGLANRINARFATVIALSFESVRAQLPVEARRRAVITGNPVRPMILGGNAVAARRWAGFSSESEDPPVVYITGGSQGARIINQAVEENLADLLNDCCVIHQCGEQPDEAEPDYDRLIRAADSLSPDLRSRYLLVRFIGEEIGDVLAAARLVIGRAGAGTVAELCAMGKPAIYVPLVPTGGDEQTKNARLCEQAGAARIVPQNDFTGARLLSEIRTLLGDTTLLGRMGQNALTLARPNAAREIAELVLGLGRGG